jgi:hypothetical protein
MCDYSLHNVISRPARVDDKLVSTKFITSLTQGFAAVGEPNVAVCLLPGTEVTFEKEVKYKRRWLLAPNQKITSKVAVFRQINMDNPNTHHDALEFPDGQVVLVNDLREGQLATVLQLPAALRAVNRENRQPNTVVA